MKLDDLVKSYCYEVGDANLNRYDRFYHFGVNGLQEMNISASGVPKTVELPILENGTCDLPLDYIQYRVIGVLGSDNQIYAIGRNDKLTLLKSYDDCGTPDRLNGESTNTEVLVPLLSVPTYSGSYRNGEFVGRMFGINGGANIFGDFRIDKENGSILLANLSTGVTSVVMEYLADINVVDGDFQVHEFLIEPLKSWIYWKSIQRNSNKSLGERQQAEKDYNLSLRNAKKRFTSSTIEEWKSAFRSGNTATVKW